MSSPSNMFPATASTTKYGMFSSKRWVIEHHEDEFNADVIGRSSASEHSGSPERYNGQPLQTLPIANSFFPAFIRRILRLLSKVVHQRVTLLRCRILILPRLGWASLALFADL